MPMDFTGASACRSSTIFWKTRLKNTELIVHWGNDPDSTRGIYGGQESAQWRLWLRELGKKQIFIDPFCNYTATILGDKWIAPRPGTDAAMAEAIAYVWLTEDTYDKEYVATHTIGFEEFKKHILGENRSGRRNGRRKSAMFRNMLLRAWPGNGLPSARCWPAVPAAASPAPAARLMGRNGPRLMIYLQAMQGLGRPGVNIWGTTMGPPYNADFNFPGYASFGRRYLNRLARSRRSIRSNSAFTG